MRRKRIADHAARARQHLENPRRQSRSVRELPEINRSQRRQAGRLQHHGIAGGERGRNFPAGDGEGKIPRDNRRHHAQRLTQGEVQSAARHRNGLPEEFPDRPRVILEDARPERDFIAGVGDGLADVPAFELRESFEIFPNEPREVKEKLRTPSGSQIAPAVRECFLRAFHRSGDIGARGGRDFAKDFLGRLLINGTHPSGIYDRTDLPTVTFSKDTQDVNVRITIHWRGKTKSLYETTYSFALNRSKSAYSLQVLRDTAAVFKIDPTNLRETESALKDVFKSVP